MKDKKITINKDIQFEERYFKNEDEWFWFLDQLGFKEEDYKNYSINMVNLDVSGTAVIEYDNYN